MADRFLGNARRAKASVERSGRLVQLFKLNRDASDSTKPWRGNAERPHPSEGGAEIPVIVAFVPPRGTFFGRDTFVEDGKTKRITEAGLLASDSIPSPFTPADVRECDHVRDGDRILRIVFHGELRPAETSILFELGLVG